MKPTIDLSLYLVTDKSFNNGRSTAAIVHEAIAGGVTLVQLREKKSNTQRFYQEALALKEALQGTGIPLIINDRLDIALAIDADGIHVGQSDMPISIVRKLLGPKKIIGLSIENLNEIKEEEVKYANYLAVSPVFSTQTKKDISQPLGLEGTRQVCSHTTLPVVGIGGITLDNAAKVIQAGASGVAVVSAILGQDDITAASKNLRKVIDTAKSTESKKTTETQEKATVATEIASETEEYYTEKYPTVLTIATSDPSGGAGSQADIKSISANGAYAACVITALTAQNTQEVTGIQAIPQAFIEAQIEAVMKDITIDTVKIGMLHDAQTICTVRDMLKKYPVKGIILDPVMVSTSGHKLLEDDAVSILQEELIPMATLITPNIPEAEILLGESITNQEDLPRVAKQLSQKYGNISVLVKAGHMHGATLIDILYNAESNELIEIPSVRINTRNTHGTGCTLSSAIAAQLAQVDDLTVAVKRGQRYISQAIKAGAHYHIGEGHGPVNHFYALNDAQSFANHPFFQSLLDGTLSTKRFTQFLLEDTRYLTETSKLMKQLAAQLPDVITKITEENTAYELAMESSYFKDLNIKQTQIDTDSKAHQAIDQYLAYLKEFVDGDKRHADASVRLEAFTECFRLYAQVGRVHKDAISLMDKSHPYYNWFKTYESAIEMNSEQYEKAFLDAILKEESI